MVLNEGDVPARQLYGSIALCKYARRHRTSKVWLGLSEVGTFCKVSGKERGKAMQSIFKE